MVFHDNSGKRGVIFVNSAGQARLKAEHSRMAEIRAAAEAPVSCGWDMPAAPARGPVKTFQPVEMRPKGSDGWAPQQTGYRGRDALRRADAFDVMIAQASRRASSRQNLFVPPFTAGQMSIARDYATLVERLEAGGMRCISLEVQSQARAGGGGEFIDAYVRDSRRLDAMRDAIGDGYAIEAQRASPFRDRRRAFRIRRMVDLVCIRQWTLSHVLGGFGWSRSTRNLDVVREALCAALDRMQGYRDVPPQNVVDN